MSDGVAMLNVPTPNGLGRSVHKMPSASVLTDDEEDLSFDSPEDEAAYYRDRYRRMVDALEDTRAELDEFQASSRELEEELEKELAATDKATAELKERIKKLEVEKEDWKNKYLNLQKMHSSTVSAMQREMDNLRSERDKTLVALRDLEMGNDELERNERVAVSSLLDLESKYNRAIEEKTLLEQEVIQKQELEEECQRLKDDMRDANSEIAILKDQITKAIPTPPSSVGAPHSPVQGASRPLSQVDIRPLSPEPPQSSKPLPPDPRPSALVRSSTMSSIPSLSPVPKRFTQTQIPASPIPNLSRSTTMRAMASPSPLARSRSGIPQPSPARVAMTANLAAKTKGFKLLHDLQARLKATDDKLNNKVPKRHPSNPLSLGKRVVSSASNATLKAQSKRVDALAKGSGPAAEQTTPTEVDRSGATFISPNGWVMVDDDTPLTNRLMVGMKHDPNSPSPFQTYPQRTSSTTSSSRPLPTRPGIPSPLTSSVLGKSTSRPPTAGSSSTRPPSRSSLAHSTRPSSRGDDTRPLSPSMIPTPRAQGGPSSFRAPSPVVPTSGPSRLEGWQSGLSSSSNSRPPSRTVRLGPHAALDKSTLRNQQSAIGRGHPSSSGRPPLASMSVSQSTPGGLKRSARRSSLGGPDAHLPPTGIPAPITPRPNRPLSVAGDGTPPPPFPRIPSAHRRDAEVRRSLIERSPVPFPPSSSQHRRMRSGTSGTSAASGADPT